MTARTPETESATDATGEAKTAAAAAHDLALRARAASRRLAALPGAARTDAVKRLAIDLVETSFLAELERANAADVDEARNAGQAEALLDRLAYGAARLRKTCDGLLDVAALPDPVGEVVERTVRPNGTTSIACGPRSAPS